MITLRHLHEYQQEARLVQLEDGRVGKIVRVDTTYPDNRTQVLVYTQDAKGPGIARVDLERIVGLANAS
jgi:hypothetical protein